MRHLIVLLILSIFVYFIGCDENERSPGNTNDTDTSDGGDDGDAGDDGGADTDTEDLIPPECNDYYRSYIWIANTGESTLSKVCTLSGTEAARYRTGPNESTNIDPSRTSVNLHGDMVVTNRQPSSGPSSVTKFAGYVKDCIDRNNNGQIDTSTGPNDIKPWGEDECMLWNTTIDPSSTDEEMGLRGTAWDGHEDPETGEGGNVWVGSHQQNTDQSAQEYMFKLDGDTGDILEEIELPFGAYGAAVDGKGGVWIARNSWSGDNAIARIDEESLEVETHSVASAYGICVDSKGRVWTTGGSYAVRYDPETDEALSQNVGASSGRGIAAGVANSAGSIWIAETKGQLIQVDEESMAVIKTVQLESGSMASTIGVAVDFQGYVWVVSQSANAAYKVDPQSYTFETFSIGQSPYTYSDMTGAQLRNVILE